MNLEGFNGIVKGIEVGKLIENLKKMQKETIILESELHELVKTQGDNYYWDRVKLDFVKKN